MIATPHHSRHVVFFRRDEVVEAARKRPGWREFHRVCGRHNIYFDDIEAVGKRQGYRAIAFEVVDRQWANPVEGRGADPVAAVADAYARQGKGNAETDAALERLLRGELEVLPVPDCSPAFAAIDDAMRTAAAVTGIDDLLGLPEEEDLIG